MSVQVRKPASKNAIRRRVRFDGELEDGNAVYRCKSRREEGKEYHPVVNLADGSVWCDCPHHSYRMTASKLGHEPTVADVQVLCHHLQRAIGEALRHGRF